MSVDTATKRKLNHLAEMVRANYPKYVPLIEGSRVLVVHRDRGVVCELGPEDSPYKLAQVLAGMEEKA